MTRADPSQPNSDLLSFIIHDDWRISFDLASWPLLAFVTLIAIAYFGFRMWTGRNLSDFEIDSAELGLGDHKITLKPNELDRQIAYSIWVELSTRKIGLPIDPDHDVISEVYNSWYNFFGVTRELIKSVPVNKVRHDSTGKIVSLSIEVLNEGLRPHLTQWQARFRHWYEQQMDEPGDLSPQEIQKNFPKYDELCADLLTVNNRLIRYREKMYQLVTGNKKS